MPLGWPAAQLHGREGASRGGSLASPFPAVLTPPACRPAPPPGAGEWLEVLGCGVMQQAILDRNLGPGQKAWAFG